MNAAWIVVVTVLLGISSPTHARAYAGAADDLSQLLDQMQKDQALRQDQQEKRENARHERIIEGCQTLKALPRTLIEDYATKHRIDPRSVSLARVSLIDEGQGCEVTLYSPIGACRYGVWFSETPPIVPIRLMTYGFQEGCRDR